MLMPPETAVLLDTPLSLFAILFAGALVGMFAERIFENVKRAKRKAYWEKSNGQRVANAYGLVSKIGRPAIASTKPADAADQLRIVMDARFLPRPLLNKPERRILAHLDRALAEEAPGWRAMGQVSLGEILASENKEAFFAINSKRVDLLIIDANCQPLHALEFQGTGHHQGTAAARDAVKKEALRRAGIGYLEIMPGDTPEELRAMVRKLVGRTTNQAE